MLVKFPLTERSFVSNFMRSVSGVDNSFQESANNAFKIATIKNYLIKAYKELGFAPLPRQIVPLVTVTTKIF